MDPRTRLNLWMLLVVVLLAALSLYGRPTVSPPLPRLGGPVAGDVGEIRIDRASAGGVIRLARRDRGWMLLEEGGAIPANAHVVAALAALGDSPSFGDYPSLEMDLASVDLQPPRARVWLNGVEYRIGAQEGIHYRRYVQLDDRVHLITDTLYRHVMGTRAMFMAGGGD